MVFVIVLAAFPFVSLADAVIPNARLRGRPGIPPIPIHEYVAVSPNGIALPSIDTIYYFDQLIDHGNPTLGTFKQRYWANWEYYEPGGPIILMTPGETNAEGFLGYLTNETINGMITQQQQGTAVVIEHRFLGYSNPYDNLTTQSLEFLTIEQAIGDLVYFAQNVVLPMPGGDKVKPDATPWVLVGGSYSGSLVSWTMDSNPGIFRAGYASSAVVQAITDFWAYFTPIQENMPQNCSSDVQTVVAYLDEIYTENNTTAIQNLKEAFGLRNLSHIEDFAEALSYNLEDWSPQRDSSGMFHQFCDALEVKDGVSAPVTGWGLENAIQAWGSFWNNTYYAHICGTTDAETCLGTYDIDTSAPEWTNVTVNNDNRSWTWLVCNQLGYYPASPPLGHPAIVSRILQPVYFERMCVYLFPEKFSSPQTPTVDEVNHKYGGWDVNVDRVFFANGRRDVWREATVSAEHLNKANTTMQPIYEHDGFHTADVIMSNGLSDETIRVTQTAALEYMKTWLARP